MKQGDAFLGGGQLHGEDHLWFIINKPEDHCGVALIVNLTTLRPGAETTCVLSPGEHPFIKHNSYIRYSGAREASVSELQNAVKRGLLKPHQAASPALLEKIRAGARASPRLPQKLRALL
jgi:hypothetical protein